MLMRKYYENKEIFITGGSGFIGKALIEKLLRSCPSLGKIYVLLRPKKGKDVEERLRTILKTSLFNRVREEQPAALRKVYAIEGDCSELGLGITPENLAKLQNVAIIVHSAASVRFDDELRDAILLNTRGTFELVKIAETLGHLEAFIHVSTTYCNPDKHVVEERIYPAYADWRTTIKLAETYNNETLNIFNMKYSNHQPNTYTFTKGLAEQIINDYQDKMPCLIFRPSIVISSLNEPVPGWTDNFNGPLGMLVACGIGILRTNCADPDIISDFVPVDIVIRALLIACYKRGMEATNRGGFSDSGELTVYNVATGCKILPITTGQIIEQGKQIVKTYPFEQTLWVPGGSITRCPFWHFIRFITLHIFMAILVDCALRFTGRKPFLLKLQRRIYAAGRALHFFVTTSWIFQNDRCFGLDVYVPESEKETFAFMHLADIDFEKFVLNGIRGAKEFLLNEKPECSRGAHIRVRIFDALNYFFQLIGSLLIIRFLLRYLYTRFLQT